MPLLDRAQARRNKIKQAARHCFLSQGLMKTSMRDIASQAGVSLGNLYQYFPDKQALVKDFILDNYLEIKQALIYIEKKADIIKALKILVKGYIADMDNKLEHALYLEIYAEALRDTQLFAYIKQYDDEDTLLAQILAKAKETQQLDFSLPCDVAAHSILAILESQSLRAAADQAYSQKQAMQNSWQAIQLLLNIKADWN